VAKGGAAYLSSGQRRSSQQKENPQKWRHKKERPLKRGQWSSSLYKTRQKEEQPLEGIATRFDGIKRSGRLKRGIKE
jgi:hypothetical protein